jgi:23S rRNA (adenine2030-N6)-methyltransferase
LNYRHAFHAGNFADVFKHVLLVRLLAALARKDKGFAYVETHAGAGRYDLRSPPARRSGEFREGIARLWDGEAPEGDLARYLETVRALNRDGALRLYPGSPRIARFLLRPQDRMRLAECAPEECARLRSEFAHDRGAIIHCGDGPAQLRAWLPPPERRGLVLIDPPYERDEEWGRTAETLSTAAARWPQGSYALWYPLKAGAPVARLKADLVRAGLGKLLFAEMTVWPEDTPFRLNGCGMLVLNPPWRFEADLEATLRALAQRLRRGPRAGARVAWLVPE